MVLGRGLQEADPLALRAPEDAVVVGVARQGLDADQLADVDDGVVDGRTSAEQSELVQLRREKRRLEMENEILRRAAAYFAAGSLPK